MSPSRRRPDGLFDCEACPELDPMTEREAWEHLQTSHDAIAGMAGDVVGEIHRLNPPAPSKSGGKRRRRRKGGDKHKRH